jgi:hypothetical protein
MGPSRGFFINLSGRTTNVRAFGQRNAQAAPDRELILHWNGSSWSVVPSASHGTASAALYEGAEYSRCAKPASSDLDTDQSTERARSIAV